MLKQHRYFKFHGKNIYFEINEVISLEEAKEIIGKFGCGKQIKWIGVGINEKGSSQNTHSHSHVYVQLDGIFQFNKKPETKIHGKKLHINFSYISRLCDMDGSYQNIRNYLKKHEKYEEEGIFSESIRISWDQAIKEALECPDYLEATRILQGSSYGRWLTSCSTFQKKWNQEHFEEIVESRKIYIRLNPWKEEMIEVKEIRTWIKKALERKEKRVPILFIVGKTKTGKTEFIRDALKGVKIEDHRGEIMFDTVDQFKNYDIRLYDDCNFKTFSWDIFKALCSTRGESIKINIKYSSIILESIPTIIIFNEGQYTSFLNRCNEEGDSTWIQHNSKTIMINNKIYMSQNEMNTHQITNPCDDSKSSPYENHSNKRDEDEIINENKITKESVIEYLTKNNISIPDELKLNEVNNENVNQPPEQLLNQNTINTFGFNQFHRLQNKNDNQCVKQIEYSNNTPFKKVNQNEFEVISG
ncbi:hypothetical protein EDI_319930 [Entamoeba dispar SAW760]|uniref:Geminivirus AL1 replication-associated protein catalytic domain-containing protein n=1 Tax=Entamoeba dispar (strain ATCC PRA-260 / SAW760) TaxID=370354 RepID=B0E796_ENTDS|nr:uncharacterized protein EDI_319930 [Entamoeba dispar SAW760]EDR29606.1 hypothetical protein EDI_319930 [Entamoeba dispar SAW760]|eukprot:EDR29606.1 hypothetical protein EDI_319930 [Entamoeba dispar SAW760]